MTELSATVILNNYTGYDWRLSSYHTGKLITLVNAETDATPLPKALKKTERLVIQAQVNASFLDEQSNEVIRTSIQYNILNELKPNTVMALDIIYSPVNRSFECEVGFLFRSDPNYQFLGSARIETPTPLAESTVSIYGQTLQRRRQQSSPPWHPPSRT